MRLTDFKVLTFDCYGTLIDWESGMTDAYRGLVARSGKSLTRDQILETHARYEAHQEAKTPTMPYSELLGVAHSKVAREWGVETTADEDIKFGSSVPDWPAFPDSAAALQYLKAYYKLVILSNVDRESFKGSNTRLQVEFHHIFTAQDIGSYKPNQRNFDYMIAKLAAEGIRKEEILHTAKVCSTTICRRTKRGSHRPGFIAVTDSRALEQRGRRGPRHVTIFNLQAWQK